MTNASTHTTPTAPPRRRGIRRPAADSFAAGVFLLPAIAVFIVLFAIPLGRSLFFSFTDSNGLTRTRSGSGWPTTQRSSPIPHC